VGEEEGGLCSSASLEREGGAGDRGLDFLIRAGEGDPLAGPRRQEKAVAGRCIGRRGRDEAAALVVKVVVGHPDRCLPAPKEVETGKSLARRKSGSRAAARTKGGSEEAHGGRAREVAAAEVACAPARPDGGARLRPDEARRRARGTPWQCCPPPVTRGKGLRPLEMRRGSTLAHQAAVQGKRGVAVWRRKKERKFCLGGER
jgi:hypothetical protein